MQKRMLLSTLLLSAFLLAACSGEAGLLEADVTPAARPTEITPLSAPAVLEGDLTLQAFAKDRTVAPASDEVFDFKVVNATDRPMPVVIALEHAAGQRWRTSLCVEKQCLLGDGSEPSVTDPVILPPYLEQTFKARIFVDASARSGQQTALTLRVEPLDEAAMPRSVTLSVQVSQP